MKTIKETKDELFALGVMVQTPANWGDERDWNALNLTQAFKALSPTGGKDFTIHPEYTPPQKMSDIVIKNKSSQRHAKVIEFEDYSIGIILVNEDFYVFMNLADLHLAALNNHEPLFEAAHTILS